MRRLIASGLAALTFAGALATAGAAAAERHGYRHHRHHGGSGAAVAAGIAGLAIGAALASDSRDGYGAYGYGDGPYRPGYYQGYWYGPPAGAYGYDYGPRYDGPRRCRTTRIWDPYIRGYIERTRCW